MAKKEEVKKSIWKECWEQYVAFIKEAWKSAWVSLRDALLAFVDALFDWAKLILGAVFKGIWDLIVLPVGKYVKQLVVDFIKRI